MQRATFYHAGCPVCVHAEQQILNIIDHTRVHVEVVHLGNDKDRLTEAEQAGVESVPALVLDGQVMHINYGASLNDLKN